MLGAALWATAGGAQGATLFHAGGNGFCEGCHDLHGARQDGPTAGSPMLFGSDPSSTCLRCHAETGAPSSILSRDGSAFTPGGDFNWLRKTFSWSEGMKRRTSAGDRHGHNVVAADHGLEPDASLATAPGGQFPAHALGCTSCHDPHQQSGGTSGSPASASGGAPYRLLGGVGYKPPGGMVTFSHAAPVAVAPSTWAETDGNHVAYGMGISEWCSNCHQGKGDAGLTQHVAGRRASLGSTIAANYNAYVRSGNQSGSRAAAYLALVPFEIGTDSWVELDPSRSAGPDARSTVMCLTCHRAHASAFEYAGRWDFSATFIADSHPRAGDAGATPGDVGNSYYRRNLLQQFGPYQRSLCNKCHAKD